ncbi:metallo-beta-lactamase superfamily protein [Trichoderma evansii]
MNNVPDLQAGPINKVQFISTGTVKIRSAMKSQPISTLSVAIRRFRSFTDSTWSEPLPIGAFLIDHRDGPILFDTGESTCCNDSGYMSVFNPTEWLTTVDIKHNEGIVEQLRALGTEPCTLQAIVLSHLHSDHVGGLKALVAEAPDVPIFVNQEHWDDVGDHQFFASLRGYSINNWPINFAPQLLKFEDVPLGPWKDSCKVTPDGSVVAVKTTGHVAGHISLIVFEKDESQKATTYVLTGDATYALDLLDSEEPDGINDNPAAAFQSLQLIKRFAKEMEVVVLPSHDPKTSDLLKDRVIYKPKYSTPGDTRSYPS